MAHPPSARTKAKSFERGLCWFWLVKDFLNNLVNFNGASGVVFSRKGGSAALCVLVPDNAHFQLNAI
jgi:hypothetical protein